MTLAVGARIGVHSVIELIGRGGMGEVYRAHDTQLDRDVALKVLPDAFARDPERTARFLREAQVLAQLKHPNIAIIHGLERSGGVCAIVMELVEGQTLADRIRHGAIPVEEALPIAKQVAEAFEAAHDKGVVHRDWKPANGKITPEGVVKVLDFGLAKALTPEPSDTSLSQAPTMSVAPTQDGRILGTAAYMAPEQARGKTVDRRADIWSFGVVFYEMLTGKRMFTSDELSDILASVLKTEPDWNALPPDTPAGIRTLLHRCLDRDPKRRIQAIGEARIVIEDCIADSAAAAAPTPSYSTKLRESLAWGAATIFLVAALTVSVLYFRQAPAEAPTTRFSVPTPLPGASPGTIAISPDGRLVTFRASADEGGSLWIRALGSLDSRALSGTEGPPGYPFWSPDSRFIAFYAGGKLKKIDVSGGPPQTLCDAPGVATSGGGTWNRDGVILFRGNDGRINRVSAVGGMATPVTTLDASRRETEHTFPDFLPDGRHFLYAARSPQPENNVLYVGSLDSKETSRLIAAEWKGMYAPPGYLIFVRERTLMAQPFDAAKLRMAGDPFPIAEHVRYSGGGRPTFSVSGNGVLVYRSGGGASIRAQLVWFDRSGKQIGVLGDEAAYGDVELSPDGKRATVNITDQGNNDIWLYDVARGLRTRFTFDPAIESTSIWSPDGSRIVFNSTRKGPSNLYHKPSTGAGAEEGLLEDNSVKFPESWSPDGRWILYADVTGNGDLRVLPLSGDKKPIPFVNTQFNEPAGRFSPDGRWIVYSSNESGRSQVYVAPFPGPGGKWQISTAGGGWPRWRRDGNEIYYIAPGNELMAAAVNGKGPSFEVGAVKPLFESRSPTIQPFPNVRYGYDVTADGQRFLVNTLPSGGALPTSDEITVVINWTADVKK